MGLFSSGKQKEETATEERYTRKKFKPQRTSAERKERDADNSIEKR
jgi:hypothetical protein